MRLAAVDLGDARVGLAVSDELGMLAHTRPALDGHDRRRLLEALVRLAKEEKLEGFLVGLPVEMRGVEGRSAKRARAFAQALADASGLSVELVDERLTTAEASRRLHEGGASSRRQKSRIDGAAAAVLLQAWLDAHPR